MKVNYLILFLIIPICIFCLRLDANAQVDNCVVYNKIIKEIIESEAGVKHHDTGMVDPYDRISHSIEVIIIPNFNFYIVREIYQFENDSGLDWFKEELKDSTFKSTYLYNSKDSLVSCSFTDGIKYSMISLNDTVIVKDFDSLINVGGNKFEYRANCKVTFSNIFYLKNNYILVCAQVKMLEQIGPPKIVSYLFKKRHKKLKLIKSSFTST